MFYRQIQLTGNRYQYKVLEGNNILFGERRTKEMGSELEGWRLNGRVSVSLGEVAYGVYGEGPPVVLVHGTPSRSCIWREVVPTLAEEHAVYVYDLLGFGESERGEGQDASTAAQARGLPDLTEASGAEEAAVYVDGVWGFGEAERGEGQDVSIAAQGRGLSELIEAWGLDEPRVAGHDIGGGIALRTHLLEGVPFERISLLDAVVLTPWGTPSLRHVKEHLGVYRTMPNDVFEAYVAARLGQATRRPMDEGVFEAYLSQWRGVAGQRAYLKKDEALLERDTAELEPRLGVLGGPGRGGWGGGGG